MQRIDVFISYKREERALADRVAQALIEHGYVAVTDLNIQKATDFGDAIDAMIREASLVIVLWTKASAASDWVRKEAAEAERLNKYLGVRVDAVAPEDLPLAVRNNNWLDVSDGPVTRGIPTVMQEVRQLIGDPTRGSDAAEVATQVAEDDLEFFQVIDQVGEAAGYRKYLEKYPDGALAEIARDRVERLTGWRSGLRKIPVLAGVGAFAASVAAYAAFQSIPEPSAAFAQLRAENAKSKEEIIAQETEIRSLSQDLEAARQRQKTLESDILQRDDTGAEVTSALRQELVDQKNREAILNQQIASLRKQMDVLGGLVEEAEAKNDAFTVQIETLGSNLNAALARAAASEREKQTAREALNDPSVGQASTTAVLGLSLEKTEFRNKTALRVVSVDPESNAYEQGLRSDNIIVEAGQADVTSVDEFKARLDAARQAGRKSFLIIVYRENNPRFVALKI